MVVDSVLACWQSLTVRTVLITFNTTSTHDQTINTVNRFARCVYWVAGQMVWAVTGRYAAVSGRATRRCRAATQQPTHDGFHDVCRYVALRHYRCAKLFSETQVTAAGFKPHFVPRQKAELPPSRTR